MRAKLLKRDFFERPTLVIARGLIGKYLVRRINGRTMSLMITEVEAYDGFDDEASHASRGQTARNTPMFGEAGTIYVYFTYGMHWMLNIVCGKEKYPAAVLIRGGILVGSAHTLTLASQNVSELYSLAKRYANRTADPRRLKNGFVEKDTMPKLVYGPARLTKALKIDKHLNGKMLSKKVGLWIEDRHSEVRPHCVVRTPRIGVSYAGKWAEKPWRFVLAQQKSGHTKSRSSGRTTRPR
ncbi:MAG: hypothetical protein UY39_C0051G0006 [Candidatus Kaiserbacteria bacterium GW2011_GWC2_49_12]|uniref:Putative 3-methyladenine DNA glycosylase n=1 Tax=Candidatus Kaiserbacteria bacterium GW2011_GWC2_49_12 TaxID=1618675 RepID=A0A0G1YH79_9BACT|nr:MAG: hypothetical protein UY39_C0051G0006 [Candidatus Kaiserbacteria bacterium GW2011_GWC2_49_12]